MINQNMTIFALISVFMYCIVMAQDTPENIEQDETAQVQDTNLEETPDEAIGDRIMEEMNGMKVCNPIEIHFEQYSFY